MYAPQALSSDWSDFHDPATVPNLVLKDTSTWRWPTKRQVPTIIVEGGSRPVQMRLRGVPRAYRWFVAVGDVEVIADGMNWLHPDWWHLSASVVSFSPPAFALKIWLVLSRYASSSKITWRAVANCCEVSCTPAASNSSQDHVDGRRAETLAWVLTLGSRGRTIGKCRPVVDISSSHSTTMTALMRVTKFISASGTFKWLVSTPFAISVKRLSLIHI